jgi:hypothetical protein
LNTLELANQREKIGFGAQNEEKFGCHGKVVNELLVTEK